jgi:hypothetical protein
VKFLGEKYLSNRKDINNLSHNLVAEYWNCFNRGYSIWFKFFKGNLNEMDPTLLVLQFLIDLTAYQEQNLSFLKFLGDFIKYPEPMNAILIKSADKR